MIFKRMNRIDMKLSRSLFLPLLAGLLATGCSEDETQSAVKGKPLELNVSLEQPQTRMTDNSTTLLTSGSLGVFLSEANDYTSRNNIKYTYANGSWSSESPVYLGVNSATLAAYHPYDASLTDAASVPLTSRVYAADKDLCYASVSGGPSMDSPTWKMALAHAYGKITLNVKCTSYYKGACAISKVGISHSGINGSCRLNLNTGGYSAASPGVSLSYDPGVPWLGWGKSITCPFLLVPTGDLSGGLTVTVKVDGHEQTASIDLPSEGIYSLDAGVNYTVNLEIRGAKLVASGVSVSKWTETTASGTYAPGLPVESNCYIIAPGGRVDIPVSRANKSDLGIQLADLGTGWSARVLWRDNSELEIVTDESLQPAGVFTVRATDPSATGNALVLIKDDNNRVLWSWHIWVTDYDPATENQTYANAEGVDYTFMDRNLGALNDSPGDVDALGLLYQWGRKDPFSGANAASNTLTLKRLYMGGSGGSYYSSVTKSVPTTGAATNLEESIRNPGIFYINSNDPYDWYCGSNRTAQNDMLWGTTKTVYDPCPTGWKVAPGEAFSNFSTTTFVRKGTTSDDWKDYPGRWLDNETTGSWFPAAGLRDSFTGTLESVGADGEYWSSAVTGIGCSLLYFSSNNVNPAGIGNRAYGIAVRCVKD